MATLYKADDTALEVTPANGKDFTVDELQSLVGGYCEMIRAGSDFLLVDEDGLAKGLPVNNVILYKYGKRLVGNVLKGTAKEF